MRLGGVLGSRVKLRHDVVGEVRRVFRAPFEVLLCVGVNGVLVTILWFFSPITIFNTVFTFHQAFMFPVVMATWMIADVPATNEIAPEADRFLRLIQAGDTVGIERLLRAKHLVLWSVVAPIALVVAAIMGATSQLWVTMWLTMLWVATVPFAALGVSCVVGVRWPYHPIRLAERWRRRADWRHMLLRWGILCVVPYGVVPAFGLIALLPLGAVLALLRTHLNDSTASLISLAIGCVVALPMAFWIWDKGTKKAAELAIERGAALTDYLANPELG